MREPMLAIFQTDFRPSLLNMLIRFERLDSELQRQGSVVKICMIQFAPEDLRLMILMRKFALCWTYLHLNQPI
jgi:hypothetical protein